MEKVIEITQDCAGVIERDNQKVIGFHTGGIQSCLITVYECDDAHVMIHDSGQLKISDICQLIKKYGNVRQVTATFGPEINSEQQQKRFNKILSNVGYGDKNINVLQCKHSPFSFQFPFNEKPTTSADSTPSYVDKIPNKDKRISIIEVNNFFLTPSSENLGLDIQYINGSYQAPRGVDYSLNELLGIVKKQPKFFFPNLAFLVKAHNIGLFKLPENLLEISGKHNVEKFMSRAISQDELSIQGTEFNKFMESA